MFRLMAVLLKNDLLINYREASGWLTPLLFFVMVITLFPLALGPDANVLQHIAPGIIWVAALLAVLLSIGDLFRLDAEEGFLESLLMGSNSLTWLVFCKILGHWLTHCLPLVVISPFLAMSFHLSFYSQMILVCSLVLGTPVLSLLGAVGAALVIGIRQSHILLPVLIMPLYIPVLIFGASVVTASMVGDPVQAQLAILAALNLISLAFAPLLTSAALRIGVS